MAEKGTYKRAYLLNDNEVELVMWLAKRMVDTGEPWQVRVMAPLFARLFEQRVEQTTKESARGKQRR